MKRPVSNLIVMLESNDFKLQLAALLEGSKLGLSEVHVCVV